MTTPPVYLWRVSSIDDAIYILFEQIEKSWELGGHTGDEMERFEDKVDPNNKFPQNKFIFAPFATNFYEIDNDSALPCWFSTKH